MIGAALRISMAVGGATLPNPTNPLFQSGLKYGCGLADPLVNATANTNNWNAIDTIYINHLFNSNMVGAKQASKSVNAGTWYSAYAKQPNLPRVVFVGDSQLALGLETI